MENKTGKYFKYAIGEIVLVVIGILIALQINNWNENQKEERVLNQSLLIIKSNIEDNLLMLDALKTERAKRQPYYKKEQIAILNNTFDLQTTQDALIAFVAFEFDANTSGYDALEKSPYLGLINGSPLHKLLLEHKTTIKDLYEMEKEANTGTDDLETKLGYVMDLNLLYFKASRNDDERKGANLNITDENWEMIVKELHNSVLFRNMISKVSIHDKTIIPKYDALIKISKEVIDEINKTTKAQHRV